MQVYSRFLVFNLVSFDVIEGEWVGYRQLEMIYFFYYLVGNKVKGRNSKRVFQENKALQIFRKTNMSYPFIRTQGLHKTFWVTTKKCENKNLS